MSLGVDSHTFDHVLLA